MTERMYIPMSQYPTSDKDLKTRGKQRLCSADNRHFLNIYTACINLFILIHTPNKSILITLEWGKSPFYSLRTETPVYSIPSFINWVLQLSSCHLNKLNSCNRSIQIRFLMLTLQFLPTSLQSCLDKLQLDSQAYYSVRNQKNLKKS